MIKPLFKSLLCISLLIPSNSCIQKGDTVLEAGFKNPSGKVQTSVYWYWISGNVSEEGVKKDLYAMKEAGIDRAFIGDIGQTDVKTPYPTVTFQSEEWWKILHTALKTATELGIEIGIFNSPGWSQSGGPWVKPEQAMRYLASTQVEVSGGQKVEIPLEKPGEDFQDVKVIAFPSVNKKAVRLSAANTKVSASPALSNLSALLDGKKETVVRFEKEGTPVILDFHADEPITLRSLKIHPAHHAIQVMARLWVKESSDYRLLSEFKLDRFNASLNVGFEPYAPVVISVPATTASDFRLELNGVTSQSGLSEVEFSSIPAVERYPEKTLAKMFQTPLPYWHEYQWPVQPEPDDVSLVVDPSQVLDISSCLQGDWLVWEAPEGNWTVLRTGMIPTGVTNSPANPDATGLEIDKMSRKHVEAHFEAYMGEIFRRIPAEDRKCWKVVVQDSYETGGQNFTDDFLQEFRERYGYDPLLFLPVYEGM